MKGWEWIPGNKLKIGHRAPYRDSALFEYTKIA